ncbi:hypothetical protein [Micromonospora sp. WMMD812]|uniref:hypothetical protein n=1 Tax=Micromonospora sp. WMMD812 TaxID=3015152 RepID=UPI00248D0679|nr:hypothetical protein [Micromonospora sp. WMMD812]WBB65542.1 hypothetical protein O7603_20325 [Micromonospora sp. WMMD812]
MGTAVPAALAGRLLLSVAIYRRLSWPRLAGLPAMVVAGLVTLDLPLLAASAAAAILGLVAVLDRAAVFSAP